MSSKLCHEGHHIYRNLHRRAVSLEATTTSSRALSSSAVRVYGSAATAVKDGGRHDAGFKAPLSEQALQREADREFFTDLLSSAATKRDVKAYLSRLKTPTDTSSSQPKRQLSQSGSYVNVGSLFKGSRAAEMSPVFSQSLPVESEFKEEETLSVALVKVQDVGKVDEQILAGVAETLAQLNRLSISPCVLVELSSSQDRAVLNEEVERLVHAINRFGDSARKVDNAFNVKSGVATIANRKLLTRPLRRGKIPVLSALGYDEEEHRMVQIPSRQVMLALTKELAGLSKPSYQYTGPVNTQRAYRKVFLDRIITIDIAGGIQNEKAADGRHVFLNLEQEYNVVRSNLQSKRDDALAIIHLDNLDLLNQALQLLPPTSSGLMTTYEEAANHGRSVHSNKATNVGTRRSKNALIHNILTDKPAYSSSLPLGRLTKGDVTTSAPIASHSSFVKRGMPVTIFPNPFEKPWKPDSPRLTLTDPRIDLPRLVHLIEDSFNRKLDVKDYLSRVNDRIAGVIIAGEYEGGAILTWESPPDSPNAPLVPYLDKFAVLKRSQGAGGVADIVFNAMVRSCFPTGVCWRSRKDNPVNKWYFERSTGTWKIPEMNWTMFWTTPNVELDSKVFKDYEGVCRGVQPSWADTKKPAD